MASTLAKRSEPCMLCRPTITSMFVSLLSMDSPNIVLCVLPKTFISKHLRSNIRSLAPIFTT